MCNISINLLWIIDPGYLNFFVLATTSSPIATSWPTPCSLPLKLHLKYSIFVRLIRNPLLSRTTLYSSNLVLASSLVSATNTISSAKSMHHDTVFHIDLEISSRMTANRKGLSVDPWCKPTPTGKDFVIPTGVCMLVDAPSYMSRIASIWLHETPLASRLAQMVHRDMLS